MILFVNCIIDMKNDILVKFVRMLFEFFYLDFIFGIDNDFFNFLNFVLFLY